MTASPRIPDDVRKWLAFGSGIGIEIGAADLEVALARVRPSRIRVLGRLTIHDYASRPAAEWGAEYLKFVRSAGMGHLSATVLLPRREVIVRQVALPGVASKDRESAIRLQLDTLHPYEDAGVCWGWSLVSGGTALVGIARREAVERYAQLFAAALHAAIGLRGTKLPEQPGGDAGFLALSRGADGSVEAYGESTARPVFSAEFDLPPERAAILALSELRLPPETAPQKLEDVLPRPDVNPVENDLSRNALPYATALAGACPLLASAANVLPNDYRHATSRTRYVPTILLAALLLLAAGAVAAFNTVADRQYLDKLHAEIARVQPQAQRATALDREINNLRARARLLDQFRGQTRGDMDALNELTKLLEPPVWSNSIQITQESARIAGEAPQAAPLLKLLDTSPLFENSEFQMLTRGSSGEVFQIRTAREKRP
jgi:Tfp pilus assembly protein PilN